MLKRISTVVLWLFALAAAAHKPRDRARTRRTSEAFGFAVALRLASPYGHQVFIPQRLAASENLHERIRTAPW